jgi:hypothetical protein
VLTSDPNELENARRATRDRIWRNKRGALPSRPGFADQASSGTHSAVEPRELELRNGLSVNTPGALAGSKKKKTPPSRKSRGGARPPQRKAHPR